MKKIVLFAAAASLLLGASVPALAAGKATNWEHVCTVRAKRHHIPGDKVAAYVKSCVAKHHKVAAKKVKTTAKPAAAPAAAPAPAAAK